MFSLQGNAQGFSCPDISVSLCLRCGARTANNRDLVERLLGLSQSEAVASRLVVKSAVDRPGRVV